MDSLNWQTTVALVIGVIVIGALVLAMLFLLGTLLRVPSWLKSQVMVISAKKENNYDPTVDMAGIRKQFHNGLEIIYQRKGNWYLITFDVGCVYTPTSYAIAAYYVVLITMGHWPSLRGFKWHVEPPMKEDTKASPVLLEEFDKVIANAKT